METFAQARLFASLGELPPAVPAAAMAEYGQVLAPPPLARLAYTRLHEVRIGAADLAARLAEGGFGDARVPAPTGEEALRRAVERLLRERAGDDGRTLDGGTVRDDGSGVAERRFLRRVRREGGVTTFVAVIENIDLDDLGLAHATELRVLYDRERDLLAATTDPRGGFGAVAEDARLGAAVRAAWGVERETRTTVEVRPLIDRLLAGLSAVPVGPGLHVVPATQGEALGRLLALVRGLPGRNRAIAPALRREEDGDAARYGELVRDGLRAALGAFTADLARFDPATVRQSTIADRVAELRRLRLLIEEHGRVFVFDGTAVAGALAEAQQALTELQRLAQAARAAKGATAPAAA